MCFGGGSQPKPPKVVYTGPSKADIKRNEEELALYQQQMTEQQEQFQAQLQAQIDRADQEYADLESQYGAQLSDAQAGAEAAQVAAQGAASDAEGNLLAAQEQAAGDLNAAAAAGAMAQNSAYDVSVSQSEPVNAQETKAITDKKKPKSSLKISQNAVEAASGTGLNIGI